MEEYHTSIPSSVPFTLVRPRKRLLLFCGDNDKHRVIFSTKGSLTLDHAAVGLLRTPAQIVTWIRPNLNRRRSRRVEADIRYFHTGDNFITIIARFSDLHPSAKCPDSGKLLHREANCFRIVTISWPCGVVVSALRRSVFEFSGSNLTVRFARDSLAVLACASLRNAQANEHSIECRRAQ